MFARVGRLLTPALAASLLAAGCGSSGIFRNGIYEDDEVRYRVGSPGRAWSRVEVDDNDVAFHHARLGTVSANSTCREYDDAPERALLNHLLFGTRERVFRTYEMVTLDGRGAIHALVDFELDGVPLTLEVYLLKKDGCVYDLTYVAGRSTHAQGRVALARLVEGFHVLATHLD